MDRLQFRPSFAVEGNTSTEYNLAKETKYVNGHGKGYQQKQKFVSFVQCGLLLTGQAGE